MRVDDASPSRRAGAVTKYYHTPEECEKLINDYIYAHDELIAELSDVRSVAEEDPRRFLDITDPDRTDYFSWPEGQAGLTNYDEEGKEMNSEEWLERVKRKAAERMRRGEAS